MSQTTRNQVPITSQRNLSVVVPPITEQERIANVLSIFDDKIRVNGGLNQTLEQIAQAIFKSWFVDFEPVKAKKCIRALGGNDRQTERAAQAVIAGAVNLDVITTATDLSALDQQLVEALSEKIAHETDEQREQLAITASHFPEQLVESELGLIPEGWEVSAFSKIATNFRESVNPETSDPSMPYVGLEHIEKKQMFLASWGCAADVDSNKSRFELGDILFGKLRPYFHKVCRPPFGGICSTDILAIRAASEEWAGFVQFQLFDPIFVAYANVRSTGTRMPRANWRDMGAYAISRPGPNLAQDFTRLTESMNAIAGSNVFSSKNLGLLRGSLLPKLLSGELPVQDAA